jgi:SAM-dependent methyltransferase
MKEIDIRPDDLLARYVELSALDAKRYFGNESSCEISCVACGAEESGKQFEKNGFSYARCYRCGTLYQTPRPSEKIFETFYRDSESSRYWAEVFFPSVAEIRREKIFRPRVKKLRQWCKEHHIHIQRLIDVGAGYGILIEEWQRMDPDVILVAVEPSAHLAAECRSKGIEVVEDVAENVTGLDGWADMVTCFEVLEHVHDPLNFIYVLKKLLRPGGILFMSTLCIDGFDLQVLWDRSIQISPPHHINFPSLKGLETLFNRAEFKNIEISTPGQLDVDIVRNAVKKDAGLLKEQRFLAALLESSAADNFQSFLVKNRLSSHAWVYSIKPK